MMLPPEKGGCTSASLHFSSHSDVFTIIFWAIQDMLLLAHSKNYTQMTFHLVEFRAFNLDLSHRNLFSAFHSFS